MPYSCKFSFKIPALEIFLSTVLEAEKCQPQVFLISYILQALYSSVGYII